MLSMLWWQQKFGHQFLSEGKAGVSLSRAPWDTCCPRPRKAGMHTPWTARGAVITEKAIWKLFY